MHRFSRCILSWNFLCREIRREVNSSWMGFLGIVCCLMPKDSVSAACSQHETGSGWVSDSGG